MIGELILVAVVLSACVGGVMWARWSRLRLERDDPARRGRPAE